jgi:hypothetical protein
VGLIARTHNDCADELEHWHAVNTKRGRHFQGFNIGMMCVIVGKRRISYRYKCSCSLVDVGDENRHLKFPWTAR